MIRRVVTLGLSAALGFGALTIGGPGVTEAAALVSDAESASEALSGSGTADASEAERLAAENGISVDRAPDESAIGALESHDVDLVSYGINSHGKLVVTVTEDSSDTGEATAAIDDFAASLGADEAGDVVKDVQSEGYSPVTGSDSGSGGDSAVAEARAVAPGVASNAVVGGGSYYTGGSVFCSFAFSGYDPEGTPIIFTAGHCGAVGAERYITVPAYQEAGGSKADFRKDAVDFGQVVFSQWGAPTVNVGDEPGSVPGNAGDENVTDVGVIKPNTDYDWDLRPAVTDWTTATDQHGSLADSVIPVKGVGLPSPGKLYGSGRTAGYVEGYIDPEKHVLDGWSKIGKAYVRGFQGVLPFRGGDSGGAVFQGNTALGIICGGGGGRAWITSLPRALEYSLPAGYEVMLDIDAPVVTSHEAGAVVEPGATISGTAAFNAESVSVDGLPEATTSAVEQEGWSFTAPTQDGTYTVALVGRNGKSSSQATSYTFMVKTTPVPVVEALEVTLGEPQILTGTGVPGATVELTGGLTGSAVVGEDGKWQITLDEPVGVYEAQLTQAEDGRASQPVEARLVVMPPTPQITEPADGSVYRISESPTTVAGTGTPGAQLTLGSGESVIVGDDGSWSIDRSEPFPIGAAKVTATQMINGLSSKKGVTEFTVDFDPTPAPTIEPLDMVFGGRQVLTGTGVPGATVTVAVVGDAGVGDAVVADDGTWSLELSMPVGEHEVTAVQSIDGRASEPAAGSVTLRPGAPEIVSPVNEAVFSESDSPRIVSGTGLPGATVELKTGQQGQVDQDGEWRIELSEPFPVGDAEIAATQTLNGLTSEAATIAFTVEADPEPTPGTEDPGTEAPETEDPDSGDSGAGDSGAGEGPAAGAAGGADSTGTASAGRGGLATTGAGDRAGLYGLGGLLLSAGLLCVGLVRRRSRTGR